ncbi:MAG: amidohydrolase [Geminicoccaceae bacterium]|nr:MAG: amidohydrolase [Geminicoccaceae bacterium]
MSPTYTLIRGGRLVDLDAHTAPPTDILIEGDTILELGEPGLAAPAEATVVDASGMLLHPGLINGHTHGPGNLAKGLGERMSLELLLTAGPWMGGGRETEDKYLTTLIGAVEMLSKGCTACYDLSYEFPAPTVEGMAASAKAYEDAGMRAVLAPMVADISFFDAIPGLRDALPANLQRAVESYRLAPTELILTRIREVVQGWRADREMVRPAVAPTIPHHCSEAFLAGCRDIAREHGLGLHSHVGESKVQAVVGRKLYGSTLLQHMDRMGLVGPDFTVAHGVWLDDEDMRRLAHHGASVSHNPGSNALLGSGIADARRMLELGVNLAIGTDGASCSDNQNMYEAMRMASYMSHVRGPDVDRWLRTGEILKAATQGSAKALGFEKLGRIAPGYKADIVFVDLATINWIPLNDPVNQLVHTEDGTGVHSVMVGGRFRYQDRGPVGIDLAKLQADAERARERLERTNRQHRALFDQLAPVVGSFCPALAREPYHVHRYGAPAHTH